MRGPALPASPNAVARVLREAEYVLAEQPTKPHPDHVRSFERARPNQLWQTDLFTFILKRQNRRVYLVAFLDDHSRFITGYGLHGSQSTPLVIEVLRAAIAGYGVPEKILTDNGTQYVTWRGKSQFTKELEKLGVRQIVAKPKRPQTQGNVERFWGTLWRECFEIVVFLDLEDGVLCGLRRWTAVERTAQRQAERLCTSAGGTAVPRTAGGVRRRGNKYHMNKAAVDLRTSLLGSTA